MFRKSVCFICFVFVLVLALPRASNAADPDIVGWWKLDETSGTIAYDSSGNGNDGACQGDVRWVAGMIGGAWEGDGAGDYIRVPHNESLMINDAITVAMWVYHTGSPADQMLCKSNGTGTGWQSNYAVRLDDQGRRINWRGRAIANQSLTSIGVVPQNEWMHIAITFDLNAPGNNNKIYINGVLDSENRSTLPLSPGPGDLYIGADQYPAGTARWWWQGRLDDVRIYNEALPESLIAVVMRGGRISAGAAYDPIPESEQTDVPVYSTVLSWTPGEYADKHDVYFGTSFDDVNNATSLDPIGPDKVYRTRQSVNSYVVPETLDFGQIYYWRIDEVNAPPSSHVVFKGDVWQFTTEPIAYPIAGENITATASSTHSKDMSPEKTINSSGLDANDFHSREATDMWLSGNEPLGAWIEFQFDKVYKLHEMWVWNSNQPIESLVGFGFKDVTIEFSTNGTDYTTLDGVLEFAQAPGTDSYAHGTTVDFGGVVARSVRLTVHSNWGFLAQYGLSEVRFFYIPIRAREPSPEPGATDVDVDVVLGWRAGREAAQHDVYLSTDEQAVVGGTAPVTTVTEASYDPLSLDLSTTYYWKINEVNMAETPTTWEGDIWSFTTRQFLVVDDFESYNDLDTTDPQSNRIFNTWIDGYGVPTNGSIVGYENPPFAERTIIHGGKQSMPFAYSNTAGAAYSEAERTFAVGQDWTKASSQTLVLYFQGIAGNTGQLYVKINGSKVVYGGDAGDIAKLQWQQWNIDLLSLGVNLQNVTNLSIGIDGNGASGTLYFDDIRLYRLVP